DECIGCTKCINACPVDAIIGSGKLMHTILTDLCTGCELCIPPCPVDCIDLVEDTQALPSEQQRIAEQNDLRQRYYA
ncbi:RnfABCDGE type electron transport complex subunit B, partial [Escherichia coli]|nr:RnfABCDGE type electron transport complex subunit B [Escherichia coli]